MIATKWCLFLFLLWWRGKNIFGGVGAAAPPQVVLWVGNLGCWCAVCSMCVAFYYSMKVVWLFIYRQYTVYTIFTSAYRLVLAVWLWVIWHTIDTVGASFIMRQVNLSFPACEAHTIFSRCEGSVARREIKVGEGVTHAFTRTLRVALYSDCMCTVLRCV